MIRLVGLIAIQNFAILARVRALIGQEVDGFLLPLSGLLEIAPTRNMRRGQSRKAMRIFPVS